MYNKVLWKCFVVVSICFLMCPKRVRVQNITLPVEQKEISENDSTPVPQKLPLIKKRKLKSVSNVGTEETGFDFTNEEMAKFKIWPQGVVPFYIDDLSFDKGFRDKLRSFLESVSGTGFHFIELPKPPKDQSRWVFFINRRGVLECSDYTTDDFTNDGVQRVTLGYDCLDREKALAGTVLALAGVPPQHNAPDRDEYVQVNIENVLPDKQNLFKSLQNNEWLFHELKYDYSSAGHFDWHKYSANGKATVKPKQKLNEDDENNTAFTLTDLQKIKMLYKFISKHAKAGNSKTAECNQLFVRGPKFRNYGSDSEENTKPRNKPNKYLGISDDVNDQDNEANKLLSNTKNNEESVEKDEEGSVEIKKDDEKNDNEQGVSVEDSKKEMKTNNQNNYVNEDLEGIEATNKEGGSKENGSKEDGSKEDDNKEDGSKEDASKEDGSKKGGSKEDGSKEDGSKEDGSKKGGSKEVGSKEDGSKEDGSKEDGSKEDGSKEDGNDVNISNDGGQDRNVIKDNDGEDSASENVQVKQVDNKKNRIILLTKRFKLSLHTTPKSTVITQNPIFDESDFNTEERWQKLKMAVDYK